MAKTKREAEGLSDAQIQEAAEVIAARLRDLVSAPITVDRRGGAIWLCHAELNDEHFAFVDIDDEGIDVMHIAEGFGVSRFKRIAKSVRNLMTILQRMRPLLDAFITHIQARHRLRVAQRVSEQITDRLMAARGLSPEDDATIPVSFSPGSRHEGVMRLVVEVNYTRLPLIAGELTAQLEDLVDLVEPKQAATVLGAGDGGADAECRSCAGYGHFDEEGNPTIDKRCRKCTDCGGGGMRVGGGAS